MQTNLALKKGTVIKIISKTEYLVRDIFDKQEIQIIISGKQRMYFYELKLGEEIYFMCSPYDSKKGRLIAEVDFKMDDDNSLSRQKYNLDNK